jgi:hypothetical protein
VNKLDVNFPSHLRSPLLRSLSTTLSLNPSLSTIPMACPSALLPSNVFDMLCTSILKMPRERWLPCQPKEREEGYKQGCVGRHDSYVLGGDSGEKYPPFWPFFEIFWNKQSFLFIHGFFHSKHRILLLNHTFVILIKIWIFKRIGPRTVNGTVRRC